MQVKPFLKWAGGKTSHLSRIDTYIPKVLSAYYEPFLGGGSVLLHVLDSLKNGERELLPDGEVIASDINAALINVYRCVKADPEPIIDELSDMQRQAHDAPSSKEFYYGIRDRYNQEKKLEDVSTTHLAALFLYLNHNCFRGLYRENRAGDFNVPYGHYKEPIVPQAITLRNAHSLFTEFNVIFKCQNATNFLEEIPLVMPAPCVFLDPPYEKLAPSTFVAYHAGGANYSFTAVCHWVCTVGRVCNTIMTNHSTPVLVRLFQDFPVCETFFARRAIHAKRPESQAAELIVCSQHQEV